MQETSEPQQTWRWRAFVFIYVLAWLAVIGGLIYFAYLIAWGMF